MSQALKGPCTALLAMQCKKPPQMVAKVDVIVLQGSEKCVLVLACMAGLTSSSQLSGNKL